MLGIGTPEIIILLSLIGGFFVALAAKKGPPRFSLRALLISMTLIADLMGMITAYSAQ